jgi:hypothetical protein
MSGAWLRPRMAAASATARSTEAGRPAIVAGGSLFGPWDKNQGSDSAQAPSALMTLPASTVTFKSSHTHPQTVQATSLKTSATRHSSLERRRATREKDRFARRMTD